MSDIRYLTTPQERRLAYRQQAGTGPGVVFLGGFKSDMEGSKAQYLDAWCAAQGRAFLRFDYSGHGQSEGAFTDGCIGDWAEDAQAAITALTDGPQILVGSSMGGWLALLAARALPGQVAGLVGIAAAPDFTQRMWNDFSAEEQAEIMEQGQTLRPSEYDAPYVITRHLIEDGQRHFLLNAPLSLPFPVRLLQGMADADVPFTEAVRLLDHLQADDARLMLVKGADHRFSTPDCLALIETALVDILANG